MKLGSLPGLLALPFAVVLLVSIDAASPVAVEAEGATWAVCHPEEVWSDVPQTPLLYGQFYSAMEEFINTGHLCVKPMTYGWISYLGTNIYWHFYNRPTRYIAQKYGVGKNDIGVTWAFGSDDCVAALESRQCQDPWGYTGRCNTGSHRVMKVLIFIVESNLLRSKRYVDPLAPHTGEDFVRRVEVHELAHAFGLTHPFLLGVPFLGCPLQVGKCWSVTPQTRKARYQNSSGCCPVETWSPRLQTQDVSDSIAVYPSPVGCR